MPWKGPLWVPEPFDGPRLILRTQGLHQASRGGMFLNRHFTGRTLRLKVGAGKRWN